MVGGVSAAEQQGCGCRQHSVPQEDEQSRGSCSLPRCQPQEDQCQKAAWAAEWGIGRKRVGDMLRSSRPRSPHAIPGSSWQQQPQCPSRPLLPPLGTAGGMCLVTEAPCRAFQAQQVHKTLQPKPCSGLQWPREHPRAAESSAAGSGVTSCHIKQALVQSLRLCKGCSS